SRPLLLQRELEPYGKALVSLIHDDPAAGAVGELKALADIRKRHLVSLTQGLCVVSDRVGNFNDEILLLSLSRDDHFAALRQQFDAMIDRVLDKRLQGQVGQQRVRRNPAEVPADVEAIAEAQLFDALVE